MNGLSPSALEWLVSAQQVPSNCQGGRGCVLDVLEMLQGTEVKKGSAFHSRACCLFPIPHPHVPHVSPPAQHGKCQRRSVKVLPKSKGTNNHSEKFWAEDCYFLRAVVSCRVLV